MAIKAYVSSVDRTRVAINTPARDTVRYISGVGLGGADGLNRISEMHDVNMTGAETNETLVYDETNGTFIVKEIPIINGGEF